jgi:hypothetical protein
VSPATEQHYSVRQVAELWGVSEKTVRRMFEDVPGVLKIHCRASCESRRSARPKRSYRFPSRFFAWCMRTGRPALPPVKSRRAVAESRRA